MTLPAPRLDDREFQDIVDEAKRRLQRLCPEWTDHNVSDPGVAVIELFAWMTELMLYRLNQVPDRLYVKFLELMGIRLHGTAAASTTVLFHLTVPQADPVHIPAGTQIATERHGDERQLVFMTEHDLVVTPPVLVNAATRTGGRYVDVTEVLRLGVEPLVCFGSLTPGDAFFFGFASSLAGNIVRLSLVTGAEGAGIDPDNPPLRWQSWTGSEWADAEVLSDTTNALNATDGGEVTLLLAGEHEQVAVGQARAYWLRCRLMAATEGQPTYQHSPVITGLRLASIGGGAVARHAEPVPTETLGVSSGEPGQTFTVARHPVLPRRPGETVRVVAPRHDGRAGAEVDWTEVEHFAGAGPQDRVFTWDDATGEIRFGPQVRDAAGRVRRYGAVPEADARITVTGYRYGGGAAGNVAARRLTVLRSAIPFVGKVSNRVAATGGVDAETLADARIRGPLSLRTGDRAVTAEDFERLTRQADPQVARAHCVPPSQPSEPVRVLVVPHSTVPARSLTLTDLALTDELAGTITAHLDPRRMVTTQVRVEEPLYQGLMVVARIGAVPGVRLEAVREAAVDALHAYVNPLVGGPDGTGWPFGRTVEDSDVQGVLRTLPGVASVDRVFFFLADLRTGTVQNRELQRVSLPADALVMSHRHQVVVE